MNITRKDRTWYEIESSVRLYVIKKITGGWVIVGKPWDGPGTFGHTYGGTQHLSDALDIACIFADKDDRHLRNTTKKSRQPKETA